MMPPPTPAQAMLTTTAPVETMADRLRSIGDVPPDRVRMKPTPGTATLDDWWDVIDAGGRCELVNGTLVELPVGFEESFIGGVLFRLLCEVVDPTRAGWVLPADGFIQLPGGLVRAPDVAYYARDSQPGGRPPRGRLPTLTPDLAIEVISRSNTQSEMRLKMREYFEAGTRQVWLVYPSRRSIVVHTSPADFKTYLDGQTAPGGEVLPGLAVEVTALFDRLDDSA